jgi:SAM-dependent methyltransferase
MFGHDTISISEYRRKYDLSQIQACERSLNRHGYSLTRFSSILDFGCGLGRLTEYLTGIAQRAALFGCDVDADSVTVCQRQCPSGNFYVNAPQAPLEYEDEQFDFIWSYSVFTHFSEPVHVMWLKELARVLAPGGVMLHTTHSSEYLRCIATFNPAALDKYQLPDGVEGFIQDKQIYHFQPFDPMTPDYGLTIISKAYATDVWPSVSGLTLAGYVEGAIEAYPEGCQDIVILAKQPR